MFVWKNVYDVIFLWGLLGFEFSIVLFVLFWISRCVKCVLIGLGDWFYFRIISGIGVNLWDLRMWVVDNVSVLF